MLSPFTPLTPFLWVLFPTPPLGVRTTAHGQPAGGGIRRLGRRGPTALASPEGPDGGAAEPRPPCPTFGAPGGGGSGVPVFSHTAAGSAASKSRRRASGASSAPSILDWPTAAGSGARRVGPARGVGPEWGGAVLGAGPGGTRGEVAAGLGRRRISGGSGAGKSGPRTRIAV